MSPYTVSYTREELIARRAELLGRIGADTVADARARAAAGDLTGEQWHLVDLLEDVEFLLGEE